MRKNKNNKDKSIKTESSSSLMFLEQQKPIISDQSYAYLENIVQNNNFKNDGLETVFIDNININHNQQNEIGLKNSNDFFEMIQLFNGYQIEIEPKARGNIVIHCRVNSVNNEDFISFDITFMEDCNYCLYTPTHINPLYLSQDEEIFLNELEILNEDIIKVLNVFRGH